MNLVTHVFHQLMSMERAGAVLEIPAEANAMVRKHSHTIKPGE